MKRLDLAMDGPVMVLDYTGQDQAAASRTIRVRRVAPESTPNPNACACGILREAHQGRGHEYQPRSTT
ncbi:MAG: hypothetical protein WC876_01690 [Candidatus Thermoplasmatota archaeon]|jgi:hypothetical protein